jgi:Domain of unknown function (DUF397)
MQAPGIGDGQPKWVKSSLSFANGNCVEVMVFDDGSADVRNSRKPEEGVLHFTPGEWAAFIGGVRNGEFDRFGG